MRSFHFHLLRNYKTGVLQSWTIKKHYRRMISLAQLQNEFKLLGGGGKIHLETNNETGIALVTLQHEERRNAITGSMVADLFNIISELEEWKQGKGLILWGGQKAFCSGADLQLVRQISTSSGGHQFAQIMQNILTRMYQLPLVSVALLSGKTLGGGAELSTACDFRLMTEGSEVQFVQTRMGVVTGWGGGTRLVHLLGRTVALELLVGCKKLNSDEGLRVGFSNGTVSSGDSMLQQCQAWLQQRIQGAPEVVRGMKQVVAEADVLSFSDSLDNERQIFSGLWGGPAQMKALEQNIKHK